MLKHSQNVTFGEVMLSTHMRIQLLQELEIKKFDGLSR